MKTTLSFLIMFICAANLLANDRIDIGIKLGGTFSKQYFKYKIDLHNENTKTKSKITDGNFGSNYGVFLEYKINKRDGVLLEVFYNRKGMKCKRFDHDDVVLSDSEKISTKNVINYLSVPLIGKYTFSRYKVYSLIGIQVDFLIDYDSEYFDYAYTKLKDDELSAVLGAGFEFEILGLSSIITEIRFNPGLTNSVRMDKLYIRNNQIIVLTGFKF